MTTEIFDNKQPLIVYGTLGDTYVYANERQIEVEEHNIHMDESEETESVTVTKYEYDVRHFPLNDKTEHGVIEALKKEILKEIIAFDSGNYSQFGDVAVNDFTMGGMHMWLDKETRNGLRFRFESQKSLGQESTTLWYGTTPISLDIDSAINMLQQLEVYASECFDCTAHHKKNIEELTDIEAVFNYDYKSGYPEHLKF